MGCPPDPVEIGIGRDNEAAHEAEAKFTELEVEKRAVLLLFGQLRALLKKGDVENALINSVQEGITEAEVTKPEPSRQGMYADAHDAWAKRHYAEQRVKARENCICVIRDGVLKLAKVIPDAELAPFYKQLASERELHRLHREDDRQTWLKWLKERMDLLTYYEGKARSKNLDLSYFVKQLSALAAEEMRVKALSSETLIEDRNIFGRNPEEFETDYAQLLPLRD